MKNSIIYLIAIMLSNVTIITVAQGGNWKAPAYGQEFGQVWYDGNAEVASYDLTIPKYGELRTGTAVAITVTEPFDPTTRVKADYVRDDSYNVIKLNLVEDFQTGVYDYNMMTSVFVAVQPSQAVPVGYASKVSFSAQEWCGHAYQQALFNPADDTQPGVRHDLHSYFEGEADQSNTLDHPANGISEDALFLWARGLAGPTLQSGDEIELPVFRSLPVQRLRHAEAKWDSAVLKRGTQSEEIKTPLGTFTCEVFTAEVTSEAGNREYKFYIDTNPEHHRRLIKMDRNDNYTLTLTGVERMPYWSLNREDDENRLPGIGLQKRATGAM
jgi:hypothetical protein